MSMIAKAAFAEELQALINRHSQERGSNTPDFILTQFLMDVLQHFNEAVWKREKWFGRHDPRAVVALPDRWWEFPEEELSGYLLAEAKRIRAADKLAFYRVHPASEGT